MADDRDCDVSSNGEVFDDVDTDPSTILQNVEQACTKVMIPTMCESTLQKNDMVEGRTGAADVIFDNMKDAESPSDEESHVKGTIKAEPPDVSPKRRLSSNNTSRTVKWTLETMCTAMDSVLTGELTTTNAARKFGIPRTTLLDRLSMKIKKQHLDTPGSFPLSPEGDERIVEFVRENANLDRPTLLKAILSMAEEISKEQGRPFENALASRKWLKLFVSKHNELDIFQYARGRGSISSHHGQRSPVTIMPVRSGSTSDVVQTTTHIIQIQPAENGQSPIHESDTHHTDGSTEQEMEPQVYDAFESSLAKQGVAAVERKLTGEQRSYFTYRFCNNVLERGYDLWKLCKSKIDGADTENFESVLSTQALVGIEQALSVEHLKYFRFRYENPALEEGYKLWSVLKEKSLQQQQ